MTEKPQNWQQVRAKIERGESSDKIGGFDPAAAPLRTDDEVLCVKFSKMVLVADVVAPVGNAAALSTGGVHAALRSASFFSSRR